MSSYHNQAIAYRPEIDGLRAIAVLPVILFHAGFELFSGGYVGVDVFFVISGYLITSIILREMEQGKFSIVRFYERRARRILPALFFVIACCLPFAILLLFPSELAAFGKSMASIAIFSSNIYFWRSTNYFTPEAEELPLLHTWSLAVEEQYYVFFPLFLMLCWRLGKSKIFWLTLFTAICSLLLAEWGWRNSPVASFYLLPTRAWELLIGSLVAMLSKDNLANNISEKTSNFASLGGFGLIIYSVLFFDKYTPFPSIYTLIPVIGTALVITFASPTEAVGRLLAGRIIVGVGLISYSAYLWHQPLLVFGKMAFPSIEGFKSIMFVSASLIFAWFTWRFIEQPFRKNSFVLKSRRRTFISVCSSLSIIGLLGFLISTENVSSHISVASNYEPRRNTVECFDFPFRNLEKVTEMPECVLGDESQTPSFLILADSQVLGHLETINRILMRNKESALVFGTSSCAPVLGVYPIRADSRQYDCYHMKELALQVAKNRNIDTLVLIGRWTYYREGGVYDDNLMQLSKTDLKKNEELYSAEVFDKFYQQSISRIKSYGLSIHVLGGPPESGDAKKSKNHFRLGSAVEKDLVSKVSQQKIRRADDIVKRNVDNFVSILEALCEAEDTEDKCRVADANGAYYVDDDHLSNHGSRAIEAELERLFFKLVTQATS